MGRRTGKTIGRRVTFGLVLRHIGTGVMQPFMRFTVRNVFMDDRIIMADLAAVIFLFPYCADVLYDSADIV